MYTIELFILSPPAMNQPPKSSKWLLPDNQKDEEPTGLERRENGALRWLISCKVEALFAQVQQQKKLHEKRS
jgi:hypothetical protein